MSTLCLIPYRDRENHLKYFNKKVIPLLKKYIPDIKIIVVEQSEGKSFNRGKLLNVGISEYTDSTISHIILHDVDIIPTEKLIKEIYTQREEDIIRIYTAGPASLGGIIKCSKECLIKINGFPNDIFGWGIEDRALFYRSKIHNCTIVNKYNQFKNQVRILSHKSRMD